MLKLYDKSSSLTFPDGSVFTSDQLKEIDAYKTLFNINQVLNIVDGVTYSFQPLANYVTQYSVEEADTPEETFSRVLAAVQAEAVNRVAAASMESMKKAAQIIALTFNDEQAIEVADLYPEYEVGHEYKQNDRFQYGHSLYKVNQAHTSQEQWVPGEVGTESLYTNLMLNDSGYQIWKQPTGAHDAYNTGDVVEYNGVLYKSLIDGNVWAPDAYPQGWQEYDASTSTEPSTPDPGTETYPEFVQPTGAHDAYKKGDIVRYNGKLYQSLIDANAYSPDAYPQGWQEYSEE